MKHFLIRRAKVKSHYWDWRLQPTHDSPVTSPTLPLTLPGRVSHIPHPRHWYSVGLLKLLQVSIALENTIPCHGGPWFSMMNRCYDSRSCFIIYLLVFMLSLLGYLGDFASHALIAFIYLYTYFLTYLFVLPKIIVFKFPWSPPSPSPPCMPPVFPIPLSKEYVLCDVSGTKQHKATLKKKHINSGDYVQKQERQSLFYITMYTH